MWNSFCIKNNIKKVFLINLEKRPDRLLLMKFKLEKMGICNYDIIEAIDGNLREYDELYKKYVSNVIQEKKLLCGSPQVSSKGAFGLLLTYKKLLSTLSTLSENENIIIFEDDIVFHKNFDEKLLAYEDDFFLSNDIIFLGANQLRWTDKMDSDIKTQKYYQVSNKKYYWNYGTYGMIMKYKILDLIKLKLNDMTSADLLTIDLIIWNIIVENNIQNKILYPNLIIPQLEESDTGSSKNIEKFADSKKWILKDYKYLKITSEFKNIYKDFIKQKDIQLDTLIENYEMSQLIENSNKSFVFIIPSYNNEKNYIKNLDSVFNQKYLFWRAIYINDASTDNTYNLVKDYIKEKGFEDKVLVLTNEKQMYQAYSRYKAYNMCKDNEICCFLDGDDWLYDDNVLNTLNDKYNEHNLLVSYGKFYIFHNNKITILRGDMKYTDDEMLDKNFNYRNKWITQHLRTCEASLIKTITQDYLKFNDEWLKCCSDKAEMWWVLEKANGRHMNIDIPLYVYNKDNSLLYENSYYNIDKNAVWKKYKDDVDNYLKNYKGNQTNPQIVQNNKNNLQIEIVQNQNNQIYLKFIFFIPYCDIYKPFIVKCLDSIENNNYKNYEVIIINDGSNDIDIILDYIKNKNNYALINFKENNGPAFSKWTFINYIQKNMNKYNYNDVVIILDGDDFINTYCCYLINKTYQKYKCWFTYGNATGKWCDFIMPSNIYKWTNIRKKKWIYNHPRSCKLFLLNYFKEDDFKFNGNWLTKGTDRPFVFNCIEMSGRLRVQYINTILYNYVEHPNNSYKNISYLEKKSQLDYLQSLTPKEMIIEEIHIVMCYWKRIDNIEKQIEMLNNQTYSKRIILHILNNNLENKEILEIQINSFKCKYNNIRILLTHYDNSYFGFQRFIYIKDVLIKNYIIDYVIIIDDDHIFENDWVEKMYNLRTPKTYICWYVKKWRKNNIDYWTDSIITHTDCRLNKNLSINDKLHYGATCGCIIDINIFNETSELWNTPTNLPENVTVYNIEDLWLSFVINYYYDWNIKRSFLTEKLSLNTNTKNSDINEHSLWKTLKREKKILLEYLVNNYDFIKE